MNHLVEILMSKFICQSSNHAAKANLKTTTGTDTSKLAAEFYLVSLKAEVDKLDIDKLIPVPVDLSKLSDVVKNDLLKKTVYDKYCKSK